VLLTALIAGATAMVIGMAAMALFSRSNVAPMLGIFVIGPLGAFAGGAFAIGRRDQPTNIALNVMWLASLLYTLFTIRLSAHFGVWGVAGQVIVLVVAVMRRSSATIATTAIAIAMTLFPPPHFVFLLDPRVGASHQVAELEINKTMLLLEYFATVVVATALSLSSRYNSPR